MCHPAWRQARIQAQRLEGFARLRRVRDRIDRERAQPLDVAVLARAAGMSEGELIRQFEEAYGKSPQVYRAERRSRRGVEPVPVGALSCPG